jgi:hypothetical protein
MLKQEARRIAGWFGVALGLLGLSSCKTYDVDVTLAPDGSGHRVVELSVGSQLHQEGEASTKQIRLLFDLEEKDGWTIVRNQDGEATGFRREIQIPDLDSWHRLGRDIHIRGALQYDTVTEVELSNSILVEAGESPLGRSLTYRERYAWTGLKEVILGFMAEQFRSQMAQAYPALDATALAELRGLMAGHLLQAWPSLLEAEDADALGADIVRSVAESALPLVQKSDPAAQLAAITAVLDQVVQDENDVLGQFLEQTLPGVEQAVFTELKLRVAMPGTIIQTNAATTDGQVASWEFDMTDFMQGPMEIFVKSEWSE